MLTTLRIRRFVIIDDVTVEFGPGLNLLTGETGAGKSILVDALGLACGGRADRSLVRSGAEQATVEAVFQLAPGCAAAAWLAEHELSDGDDGILVVRRDLSASGSNRVSINGSPCTLAMLREVGAQLLEIHGQHEHQTLLEQERQLQLLDRFGGHGRQLSATRQAWEAVGGRRAEEKRLVDEAARAREMADVLRETIREIRGLDPKPDELDRLDAERRRLRHAARIEQLSDGLVAALYDGEGAAAEVVAGAARSAAELADLDPRLTELAERLAGTAVELQEIGTSYRDYRTGTESGPDRLDELEGRRAALERLCLKHASDEAGLAPIAEAAEAELEAVENLDHRLEQARAARDEAEQDYVRAAAVLTRARTRAGRRLVPLVETQLAALALPEARLRIGHGVPPGESVGDGRDAIPLTSRGAERIELELTANPGEPFRPLSRVASGGELSRIMLALNVVDEADVVDRAQVFDEVDSGIGGAVADAVGARLARLARRRQVLCVTHLPQVAAHADRHYRVTKRNVDQRTFVGISRLSETQRIAELSRMVGGRRSTSAARQHAADLIAAAERSVTTPPRRRL